MFAQFSIADHRLGRYISGIVKHHAVFIHLPWRLWVFESGSDVDPYIVMLYIFILLSRTNLAAKISGHIGKIRGL